MFASKSIIEHLVRGIAGFTALVVAFMVMTHESLWSIPLALVGVVLLRGCPTCWLIGLMETTTARRLPSIEKICADGSCSDTNAAHTLHVVGKVILVGASTLMSFGLFACGSSTASGASGSGGASSGGSNGSMNSTGGSPGTGGAVASMPNDGGELGPSSTGIALARRINSLIKENYDLRCKVCPCNGFSPGSDACLGAAYDQFPDTKAQVLCEISAAERYRVCLGNAADCAAASKCDTAHSAAQSRCPVVEVDAAGFVPPPGCMG